MKILVYAHSFPPSKGGLQYSNFEIVKGLHKLGHDIRLITCYNKGIRQFISNFSFPVRVLPKWNFTTMNSVSRNGLLNWVFAPCYFFIILNEIHNFKPDVGFITDETANAFWGAISKSVKIPYISYCSVPVFNQKKLFSKHKLIKIIFDMAISKVISQLLKSYPFKNKNLLRKRLSKKNQTH